VVCATEAYGGSSGWAWVYINCWSWTDKRYAVLWLDVGLVEMLSGRLVSFFASFGMDCLRVLFEFLIYFGVCFLSIDVLACLLRNCLLSVHDSPELLVNVLVSLKSFSLRVCLLLLCVSRRFEYNLYLSIQAVADTVKRII